MLSARSRISRCISLLSRPHFGLSNSLRIASFSISAPALAARRKERQKGPPEEHEDKWNYNRSPLFNSALTAEDPSTFKLVTANDLGRSAHPPRSVKMLVRDFIEDSLYNPNYGYFSKQATIFDWDERPVDFSVVRDSVEFDAVVTKRYAAYEAERQLWHTPTELFKPWYGEAIAQCLVSEYLLKYFPYEDFIIYEIGAGNGTLAMNILDFLHRHYPSVYDRTRYTIIEISENLVQKQRQKLRRSHPGVQVVHQSIFHWGTREPAPCFFLAMEVVDNFAHDVIRYDLDTLQPYQGYVTIDSKGEFDTMYTQLNDPLISSFIELRQKLGHPLPISPLFRNLPILRRLYRNLPFAANLSREEYIPTRLLNLLRTLRDHFPRHRLLLSDFSSLSDTIPGVNAPVVQTRVQNTMVACETILVHQGAFDIFFPTNFERLRDMYEYVLSQPSTESARIHQPYVSLDPIPDRSTPLASSVQSVTLGADFFSSHQSPSLNRRNPLDGVSSASGLPVGERMSSVFKHAEFLETYADLSRTVLRNGENPMLDFYKNVKFLF
ncbi:S-adenosyl-L-methionine-dependent methyltransferase [Lentinula novae-zelandiae]|nr:S-adenosyl-L-methionine-dependent methyltransferase [Lentinula novae-zelandiae]